ncbi:GNAT family N-acetyltransferase [Halobacillus litoralis]|uniref:GNAT family N-acetyltransferase n=1 Tax=Halobacillus litoralis TaxID=45668 RepID=UPI001CFD2E22|nr:GNAT family N-acetyltransferase [Halobacillus litoralis]
MVQIREPEEKDLMHFTRYAIDYIHAVNDDTKEKVTSEAVRDRKYWAADQFLAENGRQKLLVADLNGRVVGYVLGILDRQTDQEVYGYLKEVFVDEFYRREGIGTKLCTSLLSWMKEEKAEVFQVSLPSSKHGESEFIGAIGFTPVSTLYEYKGSSMQNDL